MHLGCAQGVSSALSSAVQNIAAEVINKGPPGPASSTGGHEAKRRPLTNCQEVPQMKISVDVGAA